MMFLRVKEDLIITEMYLEGHKISVPEGLSELMNRSGAWKYTEQDNSSDEDNPSLDYESKVVKKNGKLRTYLNYKPTSSKGNKVCAS